MSWIVVFLGVLDLVGIYFNIRMLLHCFKNNRELAFPEKYKPFVICQFVYQVSVLAMNTVEVWNGVDVQHDDSCSFFKMLSICANIFLVSNLATMSIIAAYHPIVYKNQEFSPKLLILTPVFVGVTGSAILWWYSCWLHECESQKVAINIFLAVLLLLLFVTWIKYTQLDQTSEKLEAGLLWDTVTEQRKACFVTTWLVIFCAVVVGLGSLPWPSLEESREKTICLFLMNTVVGIAMPVALNCLFESIHEEENVLETVVIL